MKKIKLFEEFISNSSLKIGIYADAGVNEDTLQAWRNLLLKYFSIKLIELKSDELKTSNFESLDIFIIPGGNSYEQRLNISDKSIKDLTQWIDAGGNLIAVCAGFNLISYGHDWFIHLIPVENVNSGMGMSAPGVSPQLELTPDVIHIDFEITDFGKKIFGTNENKVNLYYHGGPIIKYRKDDSKFKTLFKFAEEVPHQAESKDFTKGQIAGIYFEKDSGKIIATSPHIEKSKGHEEMMANAIKFLLKDRDI